MSKIVIKLKKLDCQKYVCLEYIVIVFVFDFNLLLFIP